MRRSDAIIVLMCCCTATSRAQRVAQADDKQLVDAVMETVRAEIAKFGPYPTPTSSGVAWAIVAPKDSEWQRAVFILKQALDARDTLPADQFRYSLYVGRMNRSTDTATFSGGISVSARVSCKEPWSTHPWRSTWWRLAHQANLGP